MILKRKTMAEYNKKLDLLYEELDDLECSGDDEMWIDHRKGGIELTIDYYQGEKELFYDKIYGEETCDDDESE